MSGGSPFLDSHFAEQIRARRLAAGLPAVPSEEELKERTRLANEAERRRAEAQFVYEEDLKTLHRGTITQAEYDAARAAQREEFAYWKQPRSRVSSSEPSTGGRTRAARSSRTYRN